MRKARGFRLRFGIGSMMGLILLLALLGAHLVNSAKAQRRAVAEIAKRKGSILYDFQFAGGDPAGNKIPNARPPAPEWLRRWLGDEFFQEVVQVMLSGPNWEDDSLSALEDLPRVRELHLFQTPNITNAGLAHLRGLRRLESLDIYRNRKISDAGVAHLQGLTNLKALLMDGASVSDAGIDHLLGMKQLEELDLDRSSVGNDGLRKLKALPRLKAIYVQNSKTTESGRADFLKTHSNAKVELGTRPGSWAE